MVKIMKKTLILFAAALMTASMTSCVNNTPVESPASAVVSEISPAADSAQQPDSGEQSSSEQSGPSVTNQDELVSLLTETQFESGIAGASDTGVQVFAAFTADNTTGIFAQINPDASLEMAFGKATVSDTSASITDMLTGEVREYTFETDESGAMVMTFNGEQISCTPLESAGIESAVKLVTSTLGY